MSKIENVAKELTEAYSSCSLPLFDTSLKLPDKKEIISLLDEIKALFFPAYFAKGITKSPLNFAEEAVSSIYYKIKEQITLSLPSERQDEAREIAEEFISSLPKIHSLLIKDVEATLDGDPAASSKEEIIFSYPGFYAIFVYRVAHLLYLSRVPFMPRIMTEHAHSMTGIDINPGATIGEYFFIDHGTGIVIGETTIIGDHVKLYQGVTLGALSPRKGQSLSGVKRHPTVKNGATIYSGASILGGETVIGEGAVIGGNTFITESVEDGARVSAKKPELIVK